MFSGRYLTHGGHVLVNGDLVITGEVNRVEHRLTHTQTHTHIERERERERYRQTDRVTGGGEALYVPVVK